MTSILTDIFDDKTLLNAEIFEQEGYKHYKELQLFEKEIYNYLDNIPAGEPNVHTFGVRKAYLTARVHFWHECKKVRIDCKLIYITSSHNQRCINCGSVKTVKDLFDKEAWALMTIKRINADYISGRYNWPNYEYTIKDIF